MHRRQPEYANVWNIHVLRHWLQIYQRKRTILNYTRIFTKPFWKLRNGFSYCLQLSCFEGVFVHVRARMRGSNRRMPYSMPTSYWILLITIYSVLLCSMLYFINHSSRWGLQQHAQLVSLVITFTCTLHVNLDTFHIAVEHLREVAWYI